MNRKKSKRGKKPPGVVIYRGPSRIDGAPIVVIATFKSENAKTGDMIQTWILRSHIDPVTAHRKGADKAICGDCELRGVSCYVEHYRAPMGVYKAFWRGSYPVFNRAAHAEYFRGRKLRLGAYGDPAAAPLSAWRKVIGLVDGTTGYTHQWAKPKFHHWARLVMASTHNLAQTRFAQSKGWRTFRIAPNDRVDSTEVACPNLERGTNCIDCMGCNGCENGNTERKSFVIKAHGSNGAMFNLLKVIS